MRTIRALVIAIVGVLALAAGGPGARADKKDDVLRFAADQTPESLDPYFNNVQIGQIVAHHVWDHLIERDPRTGDYRPSLATAWRWIDDTTLEFDLRQGVKFHNGDDFGPDDVVYTLNYVIDPANRVVARQNVEWIAGADKTGPNQVRVRLKTPFPAAIDYLAGPVVIFPGRYYAQVGPAGMSARPVGSGPYRVVEHQPGRLVRFERNPDYFADSPRARPAIGKLELRFIPDVNTQIAELLTGGVDWIFNVQQDQATQLGRRAELQVTAGDTMRVAFLALNSLPNSPAPPLRDVRVRRAMIMALDRDSILKNLVGPGARLLDTICYPGQFGCTSEGAPHYAYDPARARALLAEAGYPNGFDIDIYAYRDRNQTEAMIGFLRAIGIHANLVFGQAAAVRDALRAGKAPVMHIAWGSFSIYDASASTPFFYKFTEDDVARDPEVRDWLQSADTSTDPEKRKAGYRAALARIADQAYGVPLYSLPVFYAYTRDLNFTPYPDQLPRFWESSWK